MKKIEDIEKKYEVGSWKSEDGRCLPGSHKQTGKTLAWYAQSDGVSGYASGGVEEQLPWYEGLLRRYERSLPKYEGLVPRYEGSVPWYERSLPRYEERLPGYGEQLPKYGGSLPWYEKQLPRYGVLLPWYRCLLPWYEEQLPKSEVGSWKSEESRPEKSGFDYGRFSPKESYGQFAMLNSRSFSFQNGCRACLTAVRVSRIAIPMGRTAITDVRNAPKVSQCENSHHPVEESRSEHPSACGISPKGRIEEKEQSQFSAPTGRQAIARGTVSDHWRNALGLNDIMNLIAPRLNISQGDEFAWGKNKTLRADRNRLAHLKEAEKNRSLSSQYIKNGSLRTEDRRPETEESRSFQSQLAECCHLEGGTTERSLSNKIALTGERFLTTFGMTATGKTTRLFVRNRLTHLEEAKKTSSLNNRTVLQFNNSPSRDKNIYLN